MVDTSATQSGDYFLNRGRYQYLYNVQLEDALTSRDMNRHLRYMNEIYRDGFENGFHNLRRKTRKIMALLNWLEDNDAYISDDCYSFVNWLDEVYNYAGTNAEDNIIQRGYNMFCGQGRDNGMDATIDCMILHIYG